MSLSRLETSPTEVLEHIVLCTIASSFLGPPTDLIPFLLVSRRLWRTLSFKYNQCLYARIFFLKFDFRTTFSTLPADADNGTHYYGLTRELFFRFEMLKRLRDGNYDHSCTSSFLKSDLWLAYTMFLDNEGKNFRQLIEYARVDRFALQYISLGGRLHRGAEENLGWTVASMENALALWLFWFTDKARVLSETILERQRIVQALSHLFFGVFKYASIDYPIAPFATERFPIPCPDPSPGVPIYNPELPNGTLRFGFALIVAGPPLLPPALLSCAARLEAFNAERGFFLPDYAPATQADAIAIGWRGPTLDDDIKQQVPTTKLPEWNDGFTSDQYRQDWMRLQRWGRDPDLLRRPLNCGTFTPGMLHGKWTGRWFGTSFNDFTRLVGSDRDGTRVDTFNPSLTYLGPMQFYLREHYQRNSRDRVDVSETVRINNQTFQKESSMRNAWLPDGIQFSQISRDELQISLRDETEYKYQTYCPYAAATTPHVVLDEGILDVILTADTEDEEFVKAWGRKTFYGRVRLCDGLVVLVTKMEKYDWFFTGYLHGMQNLVGVWRMTGNPLIIPMEGPWSMTKVDTE